MSRQDNSPIRPIESSLRFDCARALTRKANEKGLSRAALRSKLAAITGDRYPRQTVDNWITGRAMPRLEDMPAVDRALGGYSGDLLAELGFVDTEAMAMKWLRDTDTISDEFRGFIIDAIAAAQARTHNVVPEQGRLVS